MEKGSSPREEMVLRPERHLFSKDSNSSIRQNPLEDRKDLFQYEYLPRNCLIGVSSRFKNGLF